MIAAHVAQAGTLLSVLAFFLMARANSPRRYCRAWSFQFAAQPFWLASTWIADQWAMFAVSVFFTAIAMQAVMRYYAEMRADAERIIS